MTARVQSSDGLYRVRNFRSPVYMDFFLVFGYILSFLDRVIAKSLKSTSKSEESTV